jgi:tetratricopeptide (TPR) repeat protein
VLNGSVISFSSFLKPINELNRADPSLSPQNSSSVTETNSAHKLLEPRERLNRRFSDPSTRVAAITPSRRFGLSLALCHQQKFAEAEPIIRRALELAPSFVPGQFILAWALFGLNRLDEAEKDSHEALMRDPKLALTHLLLAHIYNRRGDSSAVLSEVDAYLRLTPDGPLSDQMRVVRISY